MQVVLYGRKSSVDRARPGQSIKGQLADARQVAGSRGWEIIAELQDEISASRHARKPRPEFDRLVAMVEAGQVEAIVCAEQSRLSRRLSEIGELFELAADGGVKLVMGGREVDLSDPLSWLMGGVQAGHDASVSEESRNRIMRGQRHAALSGRPIGHCPWGYRRIFDPQTRAFIRQEPDPEVAPTIRAAVEELLAGHSLRSVALRYAPRGDDKNLKARLLNPAMSGHRVMNGEIVARDCWPPIITDAERDQIKRLFPGRERLGARRHLLSGIAVCSKCGSGMRAHLRTGKARRYYCNQVGCHATTILADPLDQFVTIAVIARLSQPRNLAMIASQPEDEHAAERAELLVQRQRLDELAAEVIAGSLSARLAGQVEAGVLARIGELEDAMRPRGLPPELVELLRGDVEAAWQRLTIEQRVTIVRALVRVVVGASTRPRGANGFDSGRVTLDWL